MHVWPEASRHVRRGSSSSPQLRHNTTTTTAMAPRKRSRDVHDVDGEVEIESASSSFQQRYGQGPKRSRLAMAHANGGSVVSDDDTEDDFDSTMHEDDLGGTPVGSDDEEDDDEFDLQSTQFIRKEHLQDREKNMAMENGVIEEVFCRNFMCHSKLRIKLGPLINFIIGHNGSGKSAVLTALTMCLGGKATSTNRGASLKSLIKEGTDNATLAVKIKNQGDGAYKTELYGRSIIVERHFTRAGSSSFKLKNEHDKIISHKKADLDDILDFYAFQLDNPINVLTQDMARQFLSNSTPSDKYKFFLRGTQLEVLDADYALMEEHIDSIEEKLRTREQDIHHLKDKMEKAEARKKRMEKTQTMAEKISRLSWQHAWAQVEEQEVKLVDMESDVQHAIDNVQQKTDEAEVFDGTYEGQKQSFESAQRTHHDLEEQLQPLSDNHKAVNDKMQANKRNVSDILGQERECRNELKKSGKDITRIEADIQKEQDILAGAEGNEHLERMTKLEELKEEAAAKKQQHEDHLTGLTALQAKDNEAAQAVRAAEQPFQRSKEAADGATRALDRLKNTQGQEWAGYRDGMENLVRTINRESRFRTKPVGPMGKHIKILKPEWTSVIEKTMGGNMEAFIVTSKEDQNLLSQIVGRSNCRVPIMIGNPNRMDTTGKEPSADVDTMLRILEIDNDLVRNSIIINQSAEQFVLIKDADEARAFLFDGPRPHNVKAVVAKVGTSAAMRYEFSGMGAQKTSPVPAYQGASHMTTDIRDQIRQHQDAVNEATRDMEAAKASKRRLQEAHKAASANIKKHYTQEKQLKVQYQKAEDAVAEQQSLIDSNRPQDGKLQALEEQLREAKTDRENQENSYKDITLAKDDANQAAHEIKRALDEATEELSMAQKNAERAEKKLRELETKRMKALQDKNLAIQLIDQAKTEQARLETDRDTQRNTVATFIGRAEQISVRVEVPADMTAAKLDDRLAKMIEDRMREERAVGGNREDIELAYIARKDEYEHANAECSKLKLLAKVCITNLLPQPIVVCSY